MKPDGKLFTVLKRHSGMYGSISLDLLLISNVRVYVHVHMRVHVRGHVRAHVRVRVRKNLVIVICCNVANITFVSLHRDM